MKWYVPSWNGDMRLEPHPGDKSKTILRIEMPTPDEERVLNEIAGKAMRRKWLDKWEPFVSSEHPYRDANKWEFVIDAPLEEVGPMAAKIMRPGPAVLTAVRLVNGQVITSSESEADLAALAKDLAEKAEKDAQKAAKAAATVKRPTPCCPRCVHGSVGPAREVLLAFLDEHEHETWAHDRTLVVEGGLSGHRYLLAHRHTPTARRIGRVCFDLDDEAVVHFHDWTVPPEEEILAAKIILEHRESWLRNEATMFLGGRTLFKNPFGSADDGVADSDFTHNLGSVVAKMMRLLAAPTRGRT